MQEEKYQRKKRGQIPATSVKLVGAEKDAGSTRARSMRGNGIAVRHMSWNVGEKRGMSGNLAHFIAAIIRSHYLKL